MPFWRDRVMLILAMLEKKKKADVGGRSLRAK